ncbi:centrosomal protein of 72 kDa-like [Mobula hypostoma]|uniref:centrosomal protein of 72 kDa-like n=1 Tax=Mobula hypostoma TaxID=723540 RepID=UPI002FC2B138
MEYIDKRLEATKTSSLNSLQPSYNGKTTLHKLPEVDQSGDYNPRIPLGLRSGSSANVSPHLQNLLDLVDRHWSGSNSLHTNQRFLNSAEELLFNALDTMAILKIQSLEPKVKVLTEENRSLLTRTASGLDTADFPCIKHQLSQKEDDLESLNGKFEKLIEENNKLHSQLKSSELVNCARLQQRNSQCCLTEI